MQAPARFHRCTVCSRGDRRISQGHRHEGLLEIVDTALVEIGWNRLFRESLHGLWVLEGYFGFPVALRRTLAEGLACPSGQIGLGSLLFDIAGSG
jgi:hypothetical protein